MDQKTKKIAIETLENTEEIIHTEGLLNGYYCEKEEFEKSKQSLCSGSKYCMIGSLWAGYGVSPDSPDWDTVDDGCRDDFLKKNPGLRAAYDAINEVAADRFRNNPNLKGQEYYESAAEAYFEGNFDPEEHRHLGRNHLISLVRKARKNLENA